MTASSPSRITHTTYGRSRLQCPLSVWLLQGPNASPQPSVLYMAGIHGDEPLSVRVLARWLAYLKNNPSLWQHTTVALMPCLNPDGLLRNTRKNAWGVDLNRNYPTQNWQASPTTDPYHGGPSAASEPETQALLRWIHHHQPQRLISLHTPYQLINYDGPAETLAHAMGQASGYPVSADIGYATPGSFGTYWGIERQLPVITIELPEDSTPIEPVWQANRPALEVCLR